MPRAAYPQTRASNPQTSARPHFRCGLLGLASGGVCLATPVTRDAGALLPHRFTLTTARMAVCFLWHFPASRLGLLLAITLLCEVRTFLDSTLAIGPARAAAAQPTRPRRSRYLLRKVGASGLQCSLGRRIDSPIAPEGRRCQADGMTETEGFVDQAFEGLAEPQPMYKALRESSPVFRSPQAIVLSRLADIEMALKHTELFSSNMDAVDLGNVRPADPAASRPARARQVPARPRSAVHAT